MSAYLAQLAADRYEIADALHRFAFGLDHGDADSLASTLTEDCVLDFRPAGKKLGLDFPKLTGRQAIVLAQHFMPRQGPKPGAENALLMNRYDSELTRDGEKWRFKRIMIDNAWAQGHPEILNALAVHRLLSAKSRPTK
jgi:SnoaL-like domain